MSDQLLFTVPGLPPALNHAYEARGGGARGLSPTATQWRNDSILLIRDQVTGQDWERPPTGTLLYIGAIFAGPNPDRWDLDGRWKVLCDSLAHGLGVDDRWFWAQMGQKYECATAHTQVLVCPWDTLHPHISPLTPLGKHLIDIEPAYSTQAERDRGFFRGCFE